MDRRGKLDDKLAFRLGIEEPSSPFSRMFLQYKKSLKKRDSGLRPKKMAKDDKRRQNSEGIGGELGRNYIIQVKDIGEKRVKRESES